MHQQIMHMLLAKAADFDIPVTPDGQTTLLWSIQHNSKENMITSISRALLEKGANPNERDNSGRTPLLLWTVKEYDSSFVDTLIQKGAEIDSRDNNGRTPLSWAAASLGGRCTKLISALLANGVDINSQDENGVTPLAFAASRGYKEVAELLLQKGVEIDSRDNNRETPLSQSVGCLDTKFISNKKCTALISAFLTNGADSN